MMPERVGYDTEFLGLIESAENLFREPDQPAGCARSITDELRMYLKLSLLYNGRFGWYNI